jgi:hypothetical protein
MKGHSYRLYVYDKDGNLIGPAMVLTVADDETAVTQAKNCLDGHAAELRDDFRLVMKFEPKQ